MTEALTAFPDIEEAAMELLADLAPTDTTTPAAFDGPFIRITRYGGSDDRITDTARLDIDVFAATRATAYTISESVRQRMLSFPHRLSAAVIDRVVTDGAPHEVAWGDPNVRRFTASFQVFARRF